MPRLFGNFLGAIVKNSRGRRGGGGPSGKDKCHRNSKPAPTRRAFRRGASSMSFSINHLSQSGVTPQYCSNAFSTGLVLASMVILLSLNACSGGKPPIETARVCLPKPSDVPEFVKLLRETGKAHGMTFFDRTAETRVELNALENANGATRADGFVLNIGVLRPDGMGVTVSELPGPGWQVALGFSSANDLAEAERFTQAVTHILGRHWRVELIPGAAGVQPFDHCP